MTAPESYDTAHVLEPELASLGDRLLAQIVDGVIALTPLLIARLVLGQVEFMADPATLAGGLFALFYLWFADGFSNGQSWGKRVVNTAVVDSTTGEPCGFGQSLMRNIMLSLLGPIDCIFIFGRTRRRLGDFVAGTEVIELPKSI